MMALTPPSGHDTPIVAIMMDCGIMVIDDMRTCVIQHKD